MASLRKHVDTGSLAVILLTLVLFLVALFAGGSTHNMLLEAGVFLVSVKLIIMSYKNGLVSARIKERLDEIQAALRR